MTEPENNFQTCHGAHTTCTAESLNSLKASVAFDLSIEFNVQHQRSAAAVSLDISFVSSQWRNDAFRPKFSVRCPRPMPYVMWRSSSVGVAVKTLMQQLT